jgi:hypothetical protein
MQNAKEIGLGKAASQDGGVQGLTFGQKILKNRRTLADTAAGVLDDALNGNCGDSGKPVA